MAKKYLDDTGMSYFWGKLKAYFQPKLVSGTNIKTINNESILGSGNINVSYSIDFFFPVGSYYETSDTTFNPNVTWGGTWSLEAEGLVHIGAGTTYAVGTTGGAKTVTLTYANAGIKNASAEATGFGLTATAAFQNRVMVSDGSGATAHNNMPPYIVVNRWHRTA